GRGIQLLIDGQPKPNQLPTVTMLSVGPRYFDTVAVKMLRGRAFTETDGSAGQANAIVNERFVRLHFPNEDPLGKRISLTDDYGPSATTAAPVPFPAFTIVGVSPTIRQRGQQGQGDSSPDPVVYIPNAANTQQNFGQQLLVRTKGDPAQATALLREEIRALDPEQPLFNIRTMDQN